MTPFDRREHGTQVFTQRFEGREKRHAQAQARHAQTRRARQGGKVKSRKQAIAIGLSEARKKGKKVPKRKSRR
jgi:hypothetical protein